MTLFPVLAQAASFGEKLFDPAFALNYLINALVLGALYALLAMGLVIVFKATQVLNFAHGAISAMGAWFAYLFALKLNVPGRFFADDHWLNVAADGYWSGKVVSWLVSLLIALLAAALLGYILERLFIEPMVGEPIFAVAIITLGIDVALRTVFDDLVGPASKQVGDPWGFGLWKIAIGDKTVFLPYTEPTIVVIALLAAFVLWRFFRSKTGVAMRATAFDQEAAMAMGIPVRRIFGVAWMIGAALAALAGSLYATGPRAIGVGTALPFVVFRAFPVIIIGGLDSIVGAAVAGFLVAAVQQFTAMYISNLSSVMGSGFPELVPYVLMMVMLLFKPYGLFGTPEVRRV